MAPNSKAAKAKAAAKANKASANANKTSANNNKNSTNGNKNSGNGNKNSAANSNKAWPIAAGYENCPEVVEPVTLKVKGAIPSWLEGSLYRSGPGNYDLKSDAGKDVHIQHWFDGLAQLHKYEIHKGGRVTYRSRNTSDDLRERYKTAENVTGVTFCQRDPCKTIFQKFFTTFKAATMGTGEKMEGTNVNVNVMFTPNFPGLRQGADEKKKVSERKSPLRNLITTTDGNALQELDPDTLEPIRIFNYGYLDDSLGSSNLAPAHPCIDPETNEYFTSLLTFGPTALYKIVRIRGSHKGHHAEPDIDVLAEIKSPRPTYMHSFALTKRYVVVCHWQCDFKAWGLSVLWYGNAWESFAAHNPNLKCQFYVVDRHRGRHVATFEADPYYAFHTINAWDEDDDVVIDIAAYKDHTVIGDYFVDNLRDPKGKPPQQAVLRRYRLREVSRHAKVSKTNREKGQPPTPAPAAVDFELDEANNFELPTMNPTRYLRPYRYTYGVNRSGKTPSLIYDRLIRVDLDQIKRAGKNSQAAYKYWMEDQCTPSEPVFVPAPDATDEGQGVLLSIVLNGRTRTGFLLILDAMTMNEIARADMQDGHISPHNFHGVFVNSLTA
ncbi:hypothetical protein DFQ27_008730 [Actinomortierella ambigua]|uniref:Carotenoid oxygenase n=1 Tax=Actinomortierella ambigua TaxID=1343610 RepID=A0A9P6PT29_9FUNG|nr:hypothetical protein DFQ27_008730 [Actinomortierella ambigua]